MNQPIGAHVDSNDPLAEGVGLGADIVQFFLSDPQGWKAPAAERVESLAAAFGDSDLGFYIHAPYVINVASTNNRIRIPSRKLLQQTVTAAAQAGARGVIVHGGHVTADDDPEVGFDNWRKAVEGLRQQCPVLIENTAGGTNAMARHLDRLERLWGAVTSARDGAEIGFCLDTCHAFAGGLELADVVAQTTAITGRIDLVHCNNSRDAFGSGADRHASIASGTIEPDALADVVRQADAPVILETPAQHIADDLAWLRGVVA